MEVRLVELNRNGDYVRYEIIKNGTRFITGWYRYRDIKEANFWYTYHGHYGYLYTKKDYPNHKNPKPSEIGIKETINSYFDFFLTKEFCEIIKDKIRVMYNFLEE